MKGGVVLGLLLSAVACDQTLQFEGDAATTDAGVAATDASTCGCPANQRCVAGGCACAEGLSSCGGSCVDLRRDVTHCGDCGTECKGGESCAGGECKCGPGRQLCDKRCVDLSTDPEHCGGCENECTKSPACSAGECTPTCGPGLIACQMKGGVHVRCVPAAGDDENCGGCGVRCNEGKRCVAGTCAVTMPATPCKACPCAGVCEAVLGRPGACCPSENGPLCVAAAGCP